MDDVIDRDKDVLWEDRKRWARAQQARQTGLVRLQHHLIKLKSRFFFPELKLRLIVKNRDRKN